MAASRLGALGGQALVRQDSRSDPPGQGLTALSARRAPIADIGRAPPAGDQAIPFSCFRLRPTGGPLGVSLGEFNLAAGCSAVTFSRVDVAQQLELQDGTFFLPRQHVDALRPRA